MITTNKNPLDTVLTMKTAIRLPSELEGGLTLAEEIKAELMSGDTERAIELFEILDYQT